jgi:uncharacterized protein (DUF2147 family)
MRINARALQAAAILAVVVSAGAARAEETPIGIWIDHTGRGAVEITDCNGKLCGHVAWVKDAKDAQGCGEQIIGDLKSVGGGKWDNGWIYDPDRDEKFDVELTPAGNTMRVLGYAGTKWLSETMTWKRAPAELQKCSKSGTAAQAPAAKGKPETAATAPAKTQAQTKDARTDSKTEEPATATNEPEDEPETATNEPEDEPETLTTGKGGKHNGKAIAEIAEALNVKKLDGGKCRMDVPYVDMVVTFPCEK